MATFSGVIYVPSRGVSRHDELLGVTPSQHHPPGLEVPTAFNEVPAGIVNGFNNIFTLAFVPLSTTDVLLTKNGLLMMEGNDYSLAGNTILFVPTPGADQTPPIGSNLLATYRHL